MEAILICEPSGTSHREAVMVGNVADNASVKAGGLGLSSSANFMSSTLSFSERLLSHLKNGKRGGRLKASSKLWCQN